MKKLFLHVGQDKTGSSFIQSCLAKNAAALLKKYQINYPLEKVNNNAAKGHISSGNGRLFLENDLSLIRHMKRHHKTASLLFSQEELYLHLLKDNYWNNTKVFKRRLDIEQVSLLLFIRDPIEHACSLYQQKIKRGGKVITIEDFFENYHTPLNIQNFLDKALDSRCHVKVLNYSVEKNTIAQRVEQWLGIEENCLVLPEIEIVNRSMTLGELELQRYLNGVLGKSGMLLSDKLCHKLPDIKPDNMVPSVEVQNALLERLRPAMEYINSRIDKRQQYRYTLLPETVNSDSLVFSKQQLQVVIESLAHKIKALENKN